MVRNRLYWRKYLQRSGGYCRLTPLTDLFLEVDKPQFYHLVNRSENP